LLSAQEAIGSLEGRFLDVRVAVADGVELIETTTFRLIPKQIFDDQKTLTKWLLPSTKDAKLTAAVATAYGILHYYGLRTVTTRAVKAALGRPRRVASVWLRLAAILYGEPDNADGFYNAACDHLERLKQDGKEGQN
jgi:hypothetical protein